MFSRTLFALAALSLAACSLDKDDAKGAVDDSLPPAPTTGEGKADGSDSELPLELESPHPYSNNLDRAWTIDLAAALPSCAERARLHFAVLRTELGYDFVEVAGQSFDGSHDDTWTEWFDVGAGTVEVRLTTDESVTRHGFEIDLVDWIGEGPHCPPLLPCPDGTVAIRPAADACECPAQATCVELDDVTVRHSLSRGRLQSGKQIEGLVGSTLGLGAWDQIVATPIGTVDAARLDAFVGEAAASGLLDGAGYEITPTGDQFWDIFTITAGETSVTFTAPQGGHTAAVAALLARFEALFECRDGAALTCGDGYTCGNACETGCVAIDADDSECAPDWTALPGGRFETPHPYGNSVSVWKELALPATAQELRLVVNGTFALERNYDFLEVWSWRNGAWARDRRYTGTTGPALTDSFTGRYHYLRFVSDSTVTATGFDVSAEWR